MLKMLLILAAVFSLCILQVMGDKRLTLEHDLDVLDMLDQLIDVEFISEEEYNLSRYGASQSNDVDE